MQSNEQSDLEAGYKKLAEDPEYQARHRSYRFTQDDIDDAYSRGWSDGYIQGQMDYVDSSSYGYDDSND